LIGQSGFHSEIMSYRLYRQEAGAVNSVGTLQFVTAVRLCVRQPKTLWLVHPGSGLGVGRIGEYQGTLSTEGHFVADVLWLLPTWAACRKTNKQTAC
jgi:hypothetical protein